MKAVLGQRCVFWKNKIKFRVKQKELEIKFFSLFLVGCFGLFMGLDPFLVGSEIPTIFAIFPFWIAWAAYVSRQLTHQQIQKKVERRLQDWRN